MTKAYSYVRFSHPKQAHGDSFRRQIEKTRNYCSRRGLELDEGLNIWDLGKSAWKGENIDDTGALAGFIDLCKRGKIPSGSYLIVEHLDRLSRQKARKALTLFFDILDAGITVVTLEPEREYTPDIDRDPFSLIEALLYFVSANEKSEVLSKRLRDAWQKKRANRGPLTSWCPAWLKLEGDRYVLIPEKAEVVKRIVKLALDGYGDLRLVKKLNSEGVPPITDHHCWTHAFVSKLLKNPALIGCYEPGCEIDGKRVLTGETWESYFPAVIPQEEWYRLRASRRRRTYQRGPVGKDVANLFTGLLFNVIDRQPYHRIVKNHPRLISASYRNGLPGGDTQSFPYEPLEKAFLFPLAGDLRLREVFSEPQQGSDISIESLEDEVADIDNKIAVIKDRIYGESNISSLVDVLADLDRRRQVVLSNIEVKKEERAGITDEDGTYPDLVAYSRMLEEEEEVDDRTAVRTRLKELIRRNIKEMWMYVIGKKRSNWSFANSPWAL